MKRALLSVWDKTGLADFARALDELGFELVASGNTAGALREVGVPVTAVEDVTGAPEMLDGRVKTLHPRIHGGLLADLGKEGHRADLESQSIEPFDLVVSNLYPFTESPDIETIDIGGPAMVRAAAKNHAWVGVVTDPAQYDDVLAELRSGDVIKHANPCGVAVAGDVATAYQHALECDELSAFGGIVALNRPIDGATAERMVAGPQADVVIAPGWPDGSVEALTKKRRNTRLLEATAPRRDPLDFRTLSGGFLVQEAPHFAKTRAEWRVVTKLAPTDDQWLDAEMAWRVCGHVKSNCVVLVKDLQAVGIGAGQQSRVGAGEIAAQKAQGRAKGGASATDGFYPFADGIEAAADAGVAVVVQPGGAQRDDELTARADELGLAMVMTGERHFLH